MGKAVCPAGDEVMTQEILDAKTKELECKFQAMIENVEAEFLNRYAYIYDLLYSRLSKELGIVEKMDVANAIRHLKKTIDKLEKLNKK